MRNMKEHTVVVKSGRFAGQEFRVENSLEKMPLQDGSLKSHAMNGNWAAINAIRIDGYTQEDAPFYYGKIGSLGYVISHKDLPEIPSHL